MKSIVKLTVVALALSVGVANAAKPGAYIGAGVGASNLGSGLGYSRLHGYSGINSFANGHVSATSPTLAGTAFAGYNFNPYFGLEAGYVNYGTAHNTSALNGTTASIDRKLQSANLVGKAYLPIQDTGLNLYALGGVAMVKSDTTYTPGAASLVSGANFSSPTNSPKYNLRPVYGVGASYEIPNSQVTTSIEVSHLQGSGNPATSSSAIPSANLATFGLSYSFG